MSLFGPPSTASTPSTSSTSGDISKDVALSQPPDDSISALSFSPAADYLAVASWDKRLRIYEVGEQGQSQGKAEVTFDGPVLSCAWSHVSSQNHCFTCRTLLTRSLFLCVASGWYQSRRRQCRQNSQAHRSRLEFHPRTAGRSPRTRCADVPLHRGLRQHHARDGLLG